MSRIHVIGAGLAGLSAAVTATGAGRAVTLYEATAAGGGRCRSYFDTGLGMRLDNGNHLLLSGNKGVFAYLDAIGARDRVSGPRTPIFPFMDLKTGREWTLRPNLGRIPWWVLFADRRVPRATAREHLRIRDLGREWDDTVMT
jgi:phytoene dehydrogenase-like protein